MGRLRGFLVDCDVDCGIVPPASVVHVVVVEGGIALVAEVVAAVLSKGLEVTEEASLMSEVGIPVVSATKLVLIGGTLSTDWMWMGP